MSDCSNGRKYGPSKWELPFDMIVTRRRKLLGFSGLDECVKVGLWVDHAGRKRRTELVRLGCAHSIEQALGMATLGMLRHPEGTAAHRRYKLWSERLLATQRVISRVDAEYRRRIAEWTSGLPYREQARPVAVLRAPEERRDARRPDPEPPAAA